ncbi:prostaglandin reductase 3 isoform X1 [Lissotriton helveticus]
MYCMAGRRRALLGLAGARRGWHRARPIVDLSYSRHFMDFQGSSIPSVMKKLQVTKLSPDFRQAATLLTDVPVPVPGDAELLVRIRYIGINASDINYSSGRYDPTMKPPFDTGFESIGEVVGLGLSASAKYSVGQTVAFLGPGSFAEYIAVHAKQAIPLPSMNPHFLPLILSGTTAYISLKELGGLSEGKKVLVTAAAGGTGQFAVQLAKKAKCHVIGTCSSEEKAGFLKSIGCDLPINYKSENLPEVLKKQYPEGVDVVYESIGGEMFDLAVKSLATKGTMIIIGFLSGYQTSSGLPPIAKGSLPAILLKKSASVKGFFIFHYFSQYQEAMKALLRMYASGELVCEVDFGDSSPEGKFFGLESVFRAIDYMYMGKNLGKIVVELPQPVNSKL